MTASSEKFKRPLLAAGLMVLAGACFALVNLSLQGMTMFFGMPSASAVFWQYALALLFGLPWLVRKGFYSLKTDRLGLHVLRVLFAVAGVQLWGAGLAYVPIWQAIALVMTSPFFVILGARFLLGEQVGLARWGATVFGFMGAMIILAPWSDGFRIELLLPLAAAAFWGGTSVITKILTQSESADSITTYLLLLLTPANFLLAAADGFVMPSMDMLLGIIVAAGLLTVIANYALTMAYSKADAAFIQPFDHLKLPFNILAGWIAFNYAPTPGFWVGSLMIVTASFYIMWDEQGRAAHSLSKETAEA